MIILRSVYEKILYSVPETPIETGGILGIRSDVVIECVFDLNGNEYGKYVPNTSMINNIIALWQKNGIEFGGIFHSHYPSGTDLSQQDIKYIKEIMFSVKDSYSFLYFPIIIPHKELIPYKATIRDGEIYLCEDAVTIII